MEFPPAGLPLGDDVAWRAWTPAHLRDQLAPLGASVRWAVAAGWAVDLAVGRVTRDHEDLEAVVLADDWPVVARTLDGTWAVPTEGRLYPLDATTAGTTHQTWLWTGDAFVLDVFRTAHDGDTWTCHRDRTITRPWAEVVRTTTDGVPYLAPEIVLLFKAKWTRPKDEADLATLLPVLDADARAWLRAALERVHPGHPWTARL